jgi:uncharacterized membrane protein YgcG
MEILYDFFNFQQKLKHHLTQIVPLRSQKRQEELIFNFYKSSSNNGESSRPVSASSNFSLSAQSVGGGGAGGKG